MDRITRMFPNFSPLQREAVKLYFAEVLVPQWQKDFIENIKTLPVKDKRDEGYYCTYCKKFTKQPEAFESINHAIYPKGKGEIWVVNKHYDGCRGWD